jgi:hypothetical protein
MKESESQLRARLFETVKALIAREAARTGLPVALLGPSEVIQAYLDTVLPDLPKDLRMTWARDRVQKFERLSEYTRPLGFLAGYAYGASGLNVFGIDDHGVFRFCRSCVILGNCYPNLGDVATTHHGLYAGMTEETRVNPGTIAPGYCELIHFPLVDWTLTQRTLPFEGTEQDATVLVRHNVMGYTDSRANSILFGLHDAELLQMLGRMRSVIPDPIDPGLEPRAWVIAGMPLRGVPAAGVNTLEELRGQLGLPIAEPKKRGPKFRKHPEADEAGEWIARVEGLFDRNHGKEAWEMVIAHHREAGLPLTPEAIKQSVRCLGRVPIDDAMVDRGLKILLSG